MARLTIKGADEYALKLSKLGKSTETIAGKAIYSAADIVANGIKKNIQALSAVPDIENIKAYRAGEKSHLSYTQKKGLQESFGVAKMQQDNGFYNVKLGFDGYNGLPS